MRLVIVVDSRACVLNLLAASNDDWACLSIHQGIFYKRVKVHKPGMVGIRNAGVKILIGDRHALFARAVDCQQGSSTWSILAFTVLFDTFFASSLVRSHVRVQDA